MAEEGVEERSSLPLGLPLPLPCPLSCPFLPLPLPLSAGLPLPLPLPLAMSGSIGWGWFRGTPFRSPLQGGLKGLGGGDEGLKVEGGFTFGRLQGGFKGA